MDEHEPPLPLSDDAKSCPRRARVRAWVFGAGGLSLLWALNLVVLLGTVAWIACDPRLARHLDGARPFFAPDGALPVVLAEHEPSKTGALALIGAFVLASMGVLAVALVVGPRRHRQVRSWLALTALVAAWLGLWVSAPDLAWAGQRWRMGRQVAAVEPIAAALRDQWPQDDGRLPELGPFMAYPIGQPRMLMPLGSVRPAGSSNSISAIERSPAGALRFELSGSDAGAWLEWHPTGEQPASFVGGLETQYRMERASPLGDGWYLTRYGIDLASDD